MKKILLIILLIFSCSVFSGCERKDGLFGSVSDLRYDFYSGETENYRLKAYAERKETPLSHDGKVGTVAEYLTVIALNDLPDSVYTYSFSLNGKDYSGAFSLDYLSGKYLFTAEIDGQAGTSLSITVYNAGNGETAELLSAVPENALTPQKALAAVYKDNPSLFDGFRDENGAFAAELELKITVKDGKPYYFVGITSESERKIFLADGFSGKVLAVRTVA